MTLIKKTEEPQGPQENRPPTSVTDTHKPLPFADPQYGQALKRWEAERKAKEAGDVNEEQQLKAEIIEDLTAAEIKAAKAERRVAEAQGASEQVAALDAKILYLRNLAEELLLPAESQDAEAGKKDKE
ncbi:hypothetical protein FPOA_04910 [Fusarium poae]|uniref:Uncharacterized protein n=1 Tax=Fusarium poae TaxID=36050 RepID=A0A1B8AV25_FUSPO|nr:hypothetical protein FPOA_04910 [Fusarium poae]